MIQFNMPSEFGLSLKVVKIISADIEIDVN